MAEPVKIDREMTPLEYHMLRKLGLTKEEMEIVHDLARHAAEEAAERMFMIAMTAPRAEMVNLISVTSALVLGQAAQRLANQDAETIAKVMRGELHDPGFRPYGP